MKRLIAIGAALLAAALSPVFAQAPAVTPPPLAAVPAGEFAMGSDLGGSWEKPVHTVRTPAFQIGARPVTNAEFRRFRPAHESPGDKAAGAPVTGVSWLDAEAYCQWLSGVTGQTFTLPTEARWERAARGGLDSKRYPWGDQPAPDGTERRNGFGVYAVGQGLWEWTADWYNSDYYSRSPGDDPPGPAGGVYRVLRGGGYRSDPASATVFARGSARPETQSERITFRVARTDGRPTTTITTAAQPAPAQPPPAQPASARPAPAPPPTPSRAAAPAPAPAGQQPGGPVEISAVRFTDEGGEPLVAVSTSGAARFKAFALKAPDRLVVDVLDGTGTLRPGSGSVTVGRAGVKTIRYSQFQQAPPVFRIVVDLDSARNYRVEAWASELRVLLVP